MDGMLNKTWLDCVKDDMNSFGLSSEDGHDKNEWRVGTKGQSTNPRLLGKRPLKWFVCEDVCDCVLITFVTLGIKC